MDDAGYEVSVDRSNVSVGERVRAVLEKQLIPWLLAKEGVNPTIIAKITGHRKLDRILHYTSQVAAEDILSKLGGV
ncbi:hypothetical protein [Desulfurococcus mucosus]|uniref:hypothetical protein n=1 Tax=Desulfurococcus mucosus TaxID=2275 RepID=UPI0006625445|nr:hypothetical protein [Desulfurococcus mucosus]